MEKTGKKKGRVTRETVAKRARVNAVTVSRAMSDSPLIAEATRLKIKAIAAELGYVPSVLGKSHYSGRSYRLGVVVPRDDTMVSFEYFGRMVYETARFAETRGYTMSLIVDDRLSAGELVRRIRSHQVDGLLMLKTAISDSRFSELHASSVPFVLVHNRVPDKPFLSVTCDFETGMREAFKVLIERGIRTVSHVSGHPDSRDTQERRRLFGALAGEFGCRVLRIYDYIGPTSRKNGQAVAERLDSKELARAVFCSSDLIAFGFIEGLRQRSVRVPEDVAVIGFDDESIATFGSPRLTTIANPFEEIARQAATLLIGHLSGMPVESSAVPSRLVLRESL